MTINVKKPSAKHTQFGQRLTSVEVVEGLLPVEELSDELFGYVDILIGREDAPVSSPYLALMEVATAYYARALELDMLIHEKERIGEVKRGGSYYRFRTGELRSFIDLSKRCCELGSRRLSQEELLYRERTI